MQARLFGGTTYKAEICKSQKLKGEQRHIGKGSLAQENNIHFENIEPCPQICHPTNETTDQGIRLNDLTTKKKTLLLLQLRVWCDTLLANNRDGQDLQWCHFEGTMEKKAFSFVHSGSFFFLRHLISLVHWKWKQMHKKQIHKKILVQRISICRNMGKTIFLIVPSELHHCRCWSVFIFLTEKKPQGDNGVWVKFKDVFRQNETKTWNWRLDSRWGWD